MSEEKKGYSATEIQIIERSAYYRGRADEELKCEKLIKDLKNEVAKKKGFIDFIENKLLTDRESITRKLKEVNIKTFENGSQCYEMNEFQKVRLKGMKTKINELLRIFNNTIR